MDPSLTPGHPFFEVMTYPIPLSMAIDYPQGSKVEVKTLKFLGVMRYPIKVKVGGQVRSCGLKLAPHRWTLELYLDVHEGPTIHLKDLSAIFQRVDLTLLGPLYPWILEVLVSTVSTQFYGRCGLGHKTAPPMRGNFSIG